MAFLCVFASVGAFHFYETDKFYEEQKFETNTFFSHSEKLESSDKSGNFGYALFN
jgi:hypothetical protein